MTQRQYILVSVCISSFITPFLASSINVAIPAMAAGFRVEPTQLAWVVAAFLLGAACVLIPFGRLGDIMGRRRLFRIGIFCVFLATAGAGLAPSAGVLIVFRFLQGVSIAMVFSTSTALLVAAHAPSERGKAIGYTSAAVYSGLSLGPFLGGVITQYLGWRMIFFLTALILLVNCSIAGRIRGEWYGEKGAALDYPGSLLYMAGTLAVLSGLSACGAKAYAPWLLGAGSLLAMLFLWRQRRVTSPLLDVSLFRNVLFAMSNLAAFLHYSATFSIAFLLSLYLQLIRGLDEMTAGSILLLQPVMMAVLSPAAGALSDKFQPRMVASAGMGITAVGIFLLALLEEGTPFPMVGGALLVVGTGFAFFSSPNGNAIMGAVEQRQLGIASSVMAFTRIFGQAVSMTVVTLLMRSYVMQEVATEGYEEALLRGIQHLLGMFACICCVGVGISMMRGRRDEK